MNPATKQSLLLNALLLGFVLWRITDESHPQIQMGAKPSRADVVHGPVVKPAPRPPQVEPGAAAVIEISERFRWAHIESADYRIYLANLRAIACPEPTVRDIIIADVNDLFAPRVKALVDEVTGQFWELIVRPDDFEKMIEAKHAQLRELDDERDELLTELFGGSDPRTAGSGERHSAERRALWERTADFLSDEKRLLFVSAREELESRWTDFLRTPGLTGDQQQAKRKELEAAFEQTLRGELTAEEYHELRLRQSPAANLRDRLVGVDWRPEWVRALAEIQFANGEAQAGQPPNEAIFDTHTGPLPPATKMQLRELLGVDRYAILERAMDDRYEPIYRVGQRLGLSDAATAQAFDIRREAEAAANLVRTDESLASAERQARLQAIGAETKQSLSVILGATGLTAYQKLDGGWLQQIASTR